MIGKRLFDVAFALAGLAAAAIPMAFIGLLVRLTSPGPALHWSRRIGRDNQTFWMPKFRSMRINTPQLATHLLTDSDRFITPIGRLLRRSSLDELPQLWSILTGRMSVVGPRPALFNQEDLIRMRTEAGVHRLRPGLTGWAQINGRDELEIAEKVRFDAAYLRDASVGWDLQIVWRTGVKVLRREGVRQAGEAPAKQPETVRRAA